MLSTIARLQHKPRRPVFSPDGSRFLIADASRLVIYDRDGRPIVETALSSVGRAHRLDPYVFGMAWSEDDAHIATAERDATRLRATSTLAVVAETTTARLGKVAFCAGGRALAIGACTRHVHVFDVPSLVERGSLKLVTFDYEAFDIDHLVADPATGFIAASDFGGYSDDEWGHTAVRGTPKLTIIDAADPSRAVEELEQEWPITQLEFDRWRRRLFVGNYARILVRAIGTRSVLDGVDWTPYDRPRFALTVESLAICEPYIATIPDGGSPTLDVWHPTTFARLESFPLLDGGSRQTQLANAPWILATSPDGSRLVVNDLDGVRVLGYSAPTT